MGSDLVEQRAATLQIAVHRLCKSHTLQTKLTKVNMPGSCIVTKQIHAAETDLLKHLTCNPDRSHHHTWLLNSESIMWAVTTPYCIVVTATYGHADGIFSSAGVLLLQACPSRTAYCTENLRFLNMHQLSSTLCLGSPV